MSKSRKWTAEQTIDLQKYLRWGYSYQYISGLNGRTPRANMVKASAMGFKKPNYEPWGSITRGRK